MKLSAPRGFSLIELMVALAILGILVVLTIPNYQHWIANTRIRNAQESIQNGLRQARYEAVKRNANVRFELTSSSNADWQICLPTQVIAPFNCAAGATLETFVSAGGSLNVQLGASAAIPIAAFGTALSGGVPGGVTFNALGRVADYGTTGIVRIDAFTAQTGNRRLVITVAPAGSVRLCDPQLPQSTSPQGCS